MIKFAFKLIFKLAGWKLAPEVPKEAYRNCVMIAAPHTTNWDFVYALAAFALYKIPVRYAIKKRTEHAGARVDSSLGRRNLGRQEPAQKRGIAPEHGRSDG